MSKLWVMHMLEKSKQTIEGDSNIVAGGDVHNHYHYEGITEEKAREIALDTVRKELEILSGQAKMDYVEMVNRITNNIIEKIVEKNPAKIAEFAKPATQFMLHDVFESACKCEDKNIEETFIKLSIDYILNDSPPFERKLTSMVISVLGNLNTELLALIQFIAMCEGIHYKTASKEDIKQYFNVIEKIYLPNISNFLRFYSNDKFSYLKQLGIIEEQNNDVPFKRERFFQKINMWNKPLKESLHNLNNAADEFKVIVYGEKSEKEIKEDLYKYLNKILNKSNLYLGKNYLSKNEIEHLVDVMIYSVSNIMNDEYNNGQVYKPFWHERLADSIQINISKEFPERVCLAVNFESKSLIDLFFPESILFWKFVFEDSKQCIEDSVIYLSRIKEVNKRYLTRVGVKITKYLPDLMTKYLIQCFN